MRTRTTLTGLAAGLAVALGGCGEDKPTPPTALMQPPGPDSGEDSGSGKRGKGKAKTVGDEAGDGR